MEIVTSWMEKGMEEGVKQGKQNETQRFVFRQLRKRFAAMDADTEARIRQLWVEQLEELGEALLDFTRLADLTKWLDAQVPQ